MADSQHPLKTGLITLEGQVDYRPYDDDDPSNSDRTAINGVSLDQIIGASFSGRRVKITVELIAED